MVMMTAIYGHIVPGIKKDAYTQCNINEQIEYDLRRGVFESLLCLLVSN